MEPLQLPEPPLKRRGRPSEPSKSRPAFLGPIKPYHLIPDAVACLRCERLFVPWRGAKYCSLECFLAENRVVSDGSNLTIKPRQRKGDAAALE